MTAGKGRLAMEGVSDAKEFPRRGLIYGALLLVLLIFPFKAGPYWTDVATFFGIYVLLGLSLNIIVGEVGLFNMGHAAFYALGAYTTAILNTVCGIPTIWLLPVSGIVAGGFGYILTRPIIHLRGDYLLIVTIGLNEILRITLINDPWGLTGGPNGVLGIKRMRLGSLVISRPIHFYFFVLIISILAIFALLRLQRSRIGRAWNYIREDEVAAEAMGIDVRSMKLLAFVLGAGLAGIAGSIYATKMMIISPESFTFWESVVLFTIVILGGMGSIPGVIVGSAVMMILPELLRNFMQYRMLFFGAAMVVMMVFRPQGLWPSKRWQLEMGQETEE